MSSEFPLSSHTISCVVNEVDFARCAALADEVSIQDS